MTSPNELRVDPEQVISNLAAEVAALTRSRAELYAALEAVRADNQRLKSELGERVTDGGAAGDGVGDRAGT